MTSRWICWAMFTVPAALLALVVLFVAVANNTPDLLWQAGLPLIGSFVLVCAITSAIVRWRIRDEVAAFQQFAARHNGIVLRNILGEAQLRLPVNRATLVIDLRVLGARHHSGGSQWTRVALELPGLRLPAIDVMVLDAADAPSRAVWEAIEPLRKQFFWGPVKVVANPQSTPPTVEVWRFGWGNNELWLSQTLQTAPEALVNLTRALHQRPQPRALSASSGSRGKTGRFPPLGLPAAIQS